MHRSLYVQAIAHVCAYDIPRYVPELFINEQGLTLYHSAAARGHNRFRETVSSSFGWTSGIDVAGALCTLPICNAGTTSGTDFGTGI